jgi:cellulose synthase/poly-beta-1,6-N-acetylglucosamine synthase-like glycosyltransferase
MDLVAPLIVIASVFLLGQSLFTLYLMLYAWEYPERLDAHRGPQMFRMPMFSFTVLLPARHEEAVIAGTIRQLAAARYPRNLLEIIVITHADDQATIAEARRAMAELPQSDIRLETFSDGPISKPHGLNVGFRRSRKKVVTIFDAEDDIDPDIFNVVNTVMAAERVGIVQAGVQLMNFKDHWFGLHNCLEYFFWFKSRLHFHAAVGMIPLGGNTVFVRRDLVERVGGWDEDCLTEDADIGIRLSVLGERIRVVYDPQHVTREETPDTIGSLVKQRTRWSQGFMQVLRKGDWTRLPRRRQRVLAVYTLGYPILHVALMFLWPFAIFGGLFMKMPVMVTLVAFLPLYAVVFQFLASVIGAHLFAREYGLRLPRTAPLQMAVTFLPYQWLLGISAVRAAYRELESQTNWEKTRHLGAHRTMETQPAGAIAVASPDLRLAPTPAAPSLAHDTPPVPVGVPRPVWLAAGMLALATLLIALLASPATRPVALGACLLIVVMVVARQRRGLRYEMRPIPIVSVNVPMAKPMNRPTGSRADLGWLSATIRPGADEGVLAELSLLRRSPRTALPPSPNACRSCGRPAAGNYCRRCGTPVRVPG